LLPGSREQELRRIAPVMFEVAEGMRERHPEARFVVPCVDETRAEQVRRMAGGFPAELRVGGMYDLLSRARFCLVASGTATLETALFGVPMAILYRTSPMTYWIARMVVDIKHIGIVNILAKRGIVPEFIQHAATRDNILPTALDLISETPARLQMLDDLRAVREGLGGVGASDRAAERIVALLEGTAHG